MILLNKLYTNMLPESVKVGMKKHKLKAKLSESIQMIPLLNIQTKKMMKIRKWHNSS